MKIVFLDRGSIGPNIHLEKPGFAHQWVEYERTSAADVVDRAADADIIISNKVPVRAAAIEQLPKLKMIAITATGHDAFDIEACNARGIVVSNVQDYASTTVPEHTFALMLALRRSIVGYRQNVIDGEWQRSQQFCFFTHPVGDLAGSTLGIIGAGTLGQRVAQLGQAFGMKTLFAARKEETTVRDAYTSFDQVIERADVLSLHCPLTPSTRNLIAKREFERMRKKPLLLNCSRGGLVNEADLVYALDQGLISGFGFDCLTSEPPDDDNPLLGVLDRPNVIVTPHMAWASEEAMQALWTKVIKNITNFHAGTPTNQLSL